MEPAHHRAEVCWNSAVNVGPWRVATPRDYKSVACRALIVILRDMANDGEGINAEELKRRVGELRRFL